MCGGEVPGALAHPGEKVCGQIIKSMGTRQTPGDSKSAGPSRREN